MTGTATYLQFLSSFAVSFIGYLVFRNLLRRLVGWSVLRAKQRYQVQWDLHKITPGETQWQKDFTSIRIHLRIAPYIKAAFIATCFAGAYAHVLPVKVYFKFSEHSFAYLLLSIAITVFWNDLTFYLLHRFVFHTRIGMKRVHYVHHIFKDPVVEIRSAFHIGEFLALFLRHAVLLFMIPLHPVAILVSDIPLEYINVLNHLGHELFPSGFTRHPLLKFITTATHHTLHHKLFNCNYSLLINYDLIFGTQPESYHATFESIARRDPALADGSPVNGSSAKSA